MRINSRQKPLSCVSHIFTPLVPNAGSAFGPDYAHQKHSAFGIYACGFDYNCQREMQFQQVQPGKDCFSHIQSD